MSGYALDLNGGYFTAPQDVYFFGDFTITAWIYVKQIDSFSRFLDFSNGPMADNVVLGLSFNSTGKAYGQVFQNNISDEPIISVIIFFFTK